MHNSIITQNRKWWILSTMTATISMIFIDITVLPVALPTLQRELGFSDLGLQWAINIYTLVLAVLVLAGGRLGDMWGLKKAFCFGLIVFAVASAACGFSQKEWWFIFSRALQGLGGAFLIPATQGIIAAHFPPHQRGRASGIYVSIGSVFLAFGPLIGGTLTSYLSWRYVFWINLPIAAIGFLMALFIVPSMKGKKETFDMRGFLILVLGLSGVIIGLMQAQNWGWLSIPTLSFLSIGSFFLCFLFHRKHKKHATLIDFALIRKKSFIASISVIFCIQLLAMVTVFWAIYFQNILGFSPSKAGLFSFAANIPVFFMAPVSGFLVDRFGPRLPVTIGFGLIIFALSGFLIFSHLPNVWLLIPTLLLFGSGSPLIFTPSFVALRNATSATNQGIVSGTAATFRQFGATLGLTLFGTIYTSTFLGKLGKSLQENSTLSSLDPTQFEGLLSKSPQALHALGELSSSNANYVLDAAREAFLKGFSYINILATIVALIGMIIALRLLKNTPAHREK